MIGVPVRGHFHGILSTSHASLSADTTMLPPAPDEGGIQVVIVGLPRFGGTLATDVTALGVAAGLDAAYRRDGSRIVAQIGGTFALALVDRDRNQALLAVDRLGTIALSYGTTPGRLLFATDAGQVATLLQERSAADGGTARALDPQAIFDYLFSHCIPTPTSVYRGVRRLLPGHLLQFANGEAAVTSYWQPQYEERAQGGLQDLEARFLTTVRTSVAHAIEGSANPGCFLSGGTDSSTVAGMLTEVTGRPAETYSIGFDADGFDEMSYARIASQRFGTHHHEYYITPADLVRSIPDIAATCDQPFGNSSVLPTYYCAKMAAADGVDRMLGGDGGDELFGGNTRYAKQRVFEYFDRAPGLVKGLLRTGLSPSAWDSVPIVRKARSYVQQADVPMPDRMQTYNLLTRIGPQKIFEPSFLAQVDVDAPIKTMRDWYARTDTAGLLNRMLAFDLKYTLTDNDLPKVVMACHLAGVDVAFPLLDDAVVDFAERLDPDLKLKGLQLRWFFKHALRNFLPPEILTKSKHGFGLPFGIWLRKDAALQALAFESLDGLKLRGIVRPDFIDLLRSDLVGDHAMFYGELVWVMMMLEQWLRVHAPDTRLATHRA